MTQGISRAAVRDQNLARNSRVEDREIERDTRTGIAIGDGNIEGRGETRPVFIGGSDADYIGGNIGRCAAEKARSGRET